MMAPFLRATLFCLFIATCVPRLPAEGTTNSPPDALLEKVKKLEESLDFLQQKLEKSIHDLAWSQRLADIAVIEKVRLVGPPSPLTNNPTAQGAGNNIIFHAYTFLPRASKGGDKLPLLVYVHGGVHGDVDPEDDLVIIRELVQQGYAVIAPDYRGSSGYGREFWELIDYGGLENEDVFAARAWMVKKHPEIDAARVGILGWSHGGMITLMNLFSHPAEYQAAYAGVPVSDLVARMGYKGQSYRELFSAPYHLGKSAEDNVNEYRRRSPAWNAEKLQTPLLIHTATNDEDVNVLEVEHLITALKSAGKKFEYRIYTNAPGGHMFNRLDTALAEESRREIYRFLGGYLKPPRPVK